MNLKATGPSFIEWEYIDGEMVKLTPEPEPIAQDGAHWTHRVIFYLLGTLYFVLMLWSCLFIIGI